MLFLPILSRLLFLHFYFTTIFTPLEPDSKYPSKPIPPNAVIFRHFPFRPDRYFSGISPPHFLCPFLPVSQHACITPELLLTFLCSNRSISRISNLCQAPLAATRLISRLSECFPSLRTALQAQRNAILRFVSSFLFGLSAVSLLRYYDCISLRFSFRLECLS